MSNPKHLPPEALEEWLRSVGPELGIGEEEVSIAVILRVAADVAHDVARPAAPLTTFLLGMALGRGAHDGESLDELAARVSALAARWEEQGG